MKTTITAEFGLVSKASEPHSGGTQFKFHSGHRLSSFWCHFIAFLSPYTYIYLGHHRFLQNPHFIIYYLPSFKAIFFSYCSTALYWALAAVSVSWSYTQSVGLLGRGISLSQGRYLHTGQHTHIINAHRHPCLRPRGHYDRLPRYIVWHIFSGVKWNTNK
jgi:hypothetical protein